MTSKPPREIANRFQIKSTLGHGGIGVVYEAYDPVLAKTVAIKVLKEGMPPQSIIRFQQEAIAIGKLKHHNIIDVFDFNIDSQSPYLVMELLKGESLAELIKSDQWSKVSLLNILDIFTQICEGLTHAHNTNILHRDIKPSNIMLVRDENNERRVKLVDFGLAKLNDENQSITSTGATLGSPLYMSPEQVAGKELDLHTDIYSLGCVMYETICGYPPFEGNSAAETMLMHKSDPVPPIAKEFAGEEVPSQLQILIRSCLQKDKTDRPSKVEIVQRILADTVSDITPVETYEEEKPTYEFFSLRTLPRISIAGKVTIAIIAIAVFGGTIFIYLKNQAQNQEQIEKYPAVRKAFTKIPLSERNLPMAESVDIHYQPFIKLDETTNIYVGNKFVDDQFILSLKKKPITKLCLKNTIIQGKTFKVLENKPITYLDLAHTKIRNSALESIGKIKTLKHLDLENCRKLNNRGYIHLKTLQNLEFLRVKSARVNNETAKIISSLKSIKELTIEGPSKLGDTGFDYLTKLKKLTFLDLKGTEVSMKSLKKLKLFPHLKGVGISFLDLNDKGLISLIKQKPKWEKLIMAGNFDLSPKGYGQLKLLKTLKSLDVSRSDFGDDSLEEVLKLPLNSLDVRYTKVTGKGINMITNSIQIENLFISGLFLTDDDVSSLPKLKNLKVLHIEQNNLTDKSLVELAKIKSLRSIILKGTNTSDKANEKSNAGITVKGIKDFAKALPNCEILD